MALVNKLQKTTRNGSVYSIVRCNQSYVNWSHNTRFRVLRKYGLAPNFRWWVRSHIEANVEKFQKERRERGKISHKYIASWSLPDITR